MPITDDELRAAKAILHGDTNFDWLLKSGVQWYKTIEVASNLSIGEAAVRKMCERRDIRDAINYGPGLGWRIPRNSLIVYMAEMKQKSSQMG